MSDNDKTVVKYGLKFVRNMKNFESLHIEIGVEDGIRGDENVAKAFERVKGFVESRLFEEIERVEAQVKEIRQ